MTFDESPVATEEPPADPPAPPAPDPGAAPLQELTAAVLAVQQELRAANERAAARERIIDRLHEDNQKLRAGERQLVLRPVLADLQRLRNDLVRDAASVPASMSTEQMAALLGSYAHSVELTLERGGVAVLRPDPGCPFDPALHRAQAVLPAPDPQSDATVATVVSDGYLETVTDRILAPATVRVFRWTEPPAASAQPPTADPISADPLEAPHA